MAELARTCDFTVERVEVSQDLHYSTDEWLGLVFTHSNHVILEPAVQTELICSLRPERRG